jgi:hypothetical protein
MNILIFLSLMANAKLSQEERLKIKEAAALADKSIRFLPFSKVNPTIKSEKIVLIFFGALWCINTQKWNPKYLEAQKIVDSERIAVSIAKVECSIDREGFTDTKS